MNQNEIYVGARYVPVFADDPWSDEREYEPLTVVLHEGSSYTSRQFVPVGIGIDNELFWARTGDYNAQVDLYREETRLKPFAFNTVADMQDCTVLIDGAICHTNGFHSVGDGGAAWYVISDSGTANGMDVISCRALFANLVVTTDYVKPEQFGAKIYSTEKNDASVIINYLINKYSSIMLSNKYYLANPIIINNYRKIFGLDHDTCGFIFDTAINAIEINGTYSEILFYNFSIIGNENTNSCIKVNDQTLLKNSVFENMKLQSGSTNLKIKNVFSSQFNNLHFYVLNTGDNLIFNGGPCVSFRNCYFHWIANNCFAVNMSGIAQFIACNGLDLTNENTSISYIKITGTSNVVFDTCNFEDIQEHGIYIDTANECQIMLNNCKFASNNTYKPNYFVETTQNTNIVIIENNTRLYSATAPTIAFYNLNLANSNSNLCKYEHNVYDRNKDIIWNCQNGKLYRTLDNASTVRLEGDIVILDKNIRATYSTNFPSTGTAYKKKILVASKDNDGNITINHSTNNSGIRTKNAEPVTLVPGEAMEIMSLPNGGWSML